MGFSVSILTFSAVLQPMRVTCDKHIMCLQVLSRFIGYKTYTTQLHEWSRMIKFEMIQMKQLLHDNPILVIYQFRGLLEPYETCRITHGGSLWWKQIGMSSLLFRKESISAINEWVDTYRCARICMLLLHWVSSWWADTLCTAGTPFTDRYETKLSTNK